MGAFRRLVVNGEGEISRVSGESRSVYSIVSWLTVKERYLECQVTADGCVQVCGG